MEKHAKLWLPDEHPNANLTKKPDEYKKRFHVMAKPTGSTCNIDCTYCFYLHKENLLHQKNSSVMSQETLELFIKNYIEGQTGSEIVFSWQGGEPTLMGIQFYQDVVKFQKKHNKKNQRIENDLQTNGILINDNWAVFLKENNFLVGISIDGPEELHNLYRVTRKQQPTFQKVMNGIASLKKYDVPFHVLVTVNRTNARYPLEVYRFLTKELGATYIQFNPCVEPVYFKTNSPGSLSEEIPVLGSARAKPGAPDSIVTDWSVDPDDWGTFLRQVFEEWVNHDIGRVQVNLFETAVAQLLGLPAQLCITSPFCGKGLAIEKNGDIYSCDHYVYPDHRLGNIHKDNLAEMAFSLRQQSFGYAKSEQLPSMCRSCQYLNLCWGECPKNRLIRTPEGEKGLNYLCPGIQSFFDYAYPILLGLVDVIKEQMKASSIR